MATRPGDLDQLIEIERFTSADDGEGGEIITWAKINEIWAKVVDLSGAEKTEFERVQGQTKYLFTVRYPVDIIDADRILWDGEYYNIRFNKKPTRRDLYMSIEAQSGVAQ